MGGDRNGLGHAGRRRGKAGDGEAGTAAGLTAMEGWLLFSEAVKVSWAVIDCAPAVFSVALKVCTPASAAVNVKFGGQNRLRIGAREVDRPRVTGDGITEGILGRDREACEPLPAVVAGKPLSTSPARGAGVTTMPVSVPVSAGFDREVTVIDWTPAVFRVTTPLSRGASGGRTACGSVLVKWTVPR